MTPFAHRSLAVRGLALTLALGWSCALASDANASPPAAAEAEPNNTLGTIHVELRTRELTPKLNAQLVEALDAEIEDRAPKLGLVVETTPAADLVVQVEISQPQADTQLYVIQSIAVIAGDVAVRGEVQSCIECSAAELLERGLELLPDAAAALLAAKREAQQKAAKDQQAATQAPPPAPDVEFERERLLGIMGYVGISVSVLGLGSSIAGAALLARGDRYDETYVNLITCRPPGWALVGVGLATLVAGNVLLAVDLSRHHQPRPIASLRVVPQLSKAPGLLLQGRF